jgi:hypothetical protein
MVPGDDHMAFLPDQFQGGSSISFFSIAIMGPGESGDIPQTNQLIIAPFICFTQDSSKAFMILVDI